MTTASIIGREFGFNLLQRLDQGNSEDSLLASLNEAVAAHLIEELPDHNDRYAQGFLYLVAIMDWHSRHVLAWKLSNTMDTDFCVTALEAALGKGRPEVFNTDQGAQFTSDAFTQTLEERGIRVSMDGKGRYLDNIFVERLWRSIKYEEVYLKAYQTVAEARVGINAYLEFYNRRRPHQSLGYRTPAQVYQKGQAEKRVAAQEPGLTSGLVKPSVGAGDSLNLALRLS